LTGGLSPLALSQAFTDWAEHLMMSPDKQAELIRDAAATKLLPSEAEIPEASCH
jgi:Poly-beta-hydroxybutyrate polymerase N terminal